MDVASIEILVELDFDEIASQLFISFSFCLTYIIPHLATYQRSRRPKNLTKDLVLILLSLQ